MSSQTNLTTPSAVFFYDQRGAVRNIKRFKKQPDQLPASLRNLIYAKAANLHKGRQKLGLEFNSDSTDTFKANQNVTLASKLADLTIYSEESFDSYPPGTASTGRRRTGRSSRASTITNPGAFIDTKLYAMRPITDGLINDLQEYLNRFIAVDMRPVLSGPVIYELHADWSDLTVDCAYTYPQWRTKFARDISLKVKEGGRRHDDDAVSVTSSIGARSSALDMTSSTIQPLTTPQKETSHSNRSIGNTSNKKEADKNKKPHALARLYPISEEQRYKGSARKSITNQSERTESPAISSSRAGDQPNHQQPQQLNKKIHFEVGDNRHQTKGGHRKASILKSTHQQNAFDANRAAMNVSNNSGCQVNYQLSDTAYEEKGWTAFKERADQDPHELEKKAFRALHKSLVSIDEIRVRCERLGLTKPCKVRFYGDHKREQIEKYKNSTIKPKKSSFAMAILRKELPKPLEYESLIEHIPMVSTMATSSLGVNPLSSLSIAAPTTVIEQSIAPTTVVSNQVLCSTHTNDGTACIFYPSGRLAVLHSNVFGFYIETSTNTSSSASNSINQFSNISNTNNQSNTTNQSSNVQNTQNLNPNINLNLNWQNVKDSYATIVFDDVKDEYPQSGRSTVQSGAITDGQLLAVISANGCCVCYRKDSSPKFVCTEYGGCLCDEKGSAVFQWRWEDLKPSDGERLKSNLKVQLNKNLKLDYKNPFNITLRFNCDKEIIEYELGCIRDNLPKLNELLHRTASDLPLQSKLGYSKISKGTKTPTLLNIKQQQMQQQQQAAPPPPPAKKEKKEKESKEQKEQKEQKDLRDSKDYKEYKELKDNSNLNITTNTTMTTIETKVLEKLLDNTVTYKDVPIMKELLTTQKKIRSILDEWLAFYRTTLGVLEPNMYILPDFPQSRTFNQENKNFNKITIFKRKSKSADLKDPSESRKTCLERSNSAYINDLETMINEGQDFLESDINRKTKTVRIKKDLSERIKQFRKEITSNQPLDYNPKRKYRRNVRTEPGREKPTAQTIFAPPVVEIQRALRIRPLPNNDLTASDEQCPITLRYKILFDRKVDCRCKRNIVPIITDVELDRFLRSLPDNQLLVVGIINTKQTSMSNIEGIIEQTYSFYNKYHSKPCVQSARDDVRFVFYDIDTAVFNSNHTQPLLVTRHNVMSGMVLIYYNAKLVFCDHIFNGYGCSLGDFSKQIQKSKQDAKLGRFLPYNFRFSRPRGLHGFRTPWGGEIGGLIMVDTDSLNAKHLTSSLDSLQHLKKENLSIYLKKENTTIPKPFNLPKLTKIKTSSIEV